MTESAIRKLSLEKMLSLTEEPDIMAQLRYIYMQCKDGLPYRRLELNSLEGYDLFGLSSKNLEAGDIIYDGSFDSCSSYAPDTYGIRIPSRKRLSSFLKQFDDNSNAKGLARVSDAIDFVHRKIPYVSEFLIGDDDGKAFFSALDILYSGKLFNLEDFIEHRIPAICFSQAAVLSVLINNDDELSEEGLKAKMVAGISLKEFGGLHSWIRLEVPPGLNNLGFKYRQYLLDQTENKILVYAVAAGKEFRNRNEAISLGLPSSRVCLVELENGEYHIGPRKVELKVGIATKVKL